MPQWSEQDHDQVNWVFVCYLLLSGYVWCNIGKSLSNDKIKYSDAAIGPYYLKKIFCKQAHILLTPQHKSMKNVIRLACEVFNT